MEDREKKFDEKEENLDYNTSYTKHLERKIRTLEAEKYFSIKLKSLDDFVSIANNYRIPVIFKKTEEYLTIYYDTPLFWFKP